MTPHRIAGAAAIVFGLLTLLSGGAALLGAVDMGAVVPFVLWFNFLAGLAYVAGGLLLALDRPQALPLAAAILIATVLVFAAFGWRVLSGGAFEMRTLGAMALRTAFWAGMVLLAARRRRRTLPGPGAGRAV